MVIISKCNAEWQVVCFMMKNVQSLWYSKLRSLTAATRSHGTNQITRHKPGHTGQIRNQTWPPGTARRSRLRRDGSYFDLSRPILIYVDLSWTIFTYLYRSSPILTYLDLHKSFAAYSIVMLVFYDGFLILSFTINVCFKSTCVFTLRC